VRDVDAGKIEIFSSVGSNMFHLLLMVMVSAVVLEAVGREGLYNRTDSEPRKFSKSLWVWIGNLILYGKHHIQKVSL
jgi:hypothetical protein